MPTYRHELRNQSLQLFGDYYRLARKLARRGGSERVRIEILMIALRIWPITEQRANISARTMYYQIRQASRRYRFLSDQARLLPDPAFEPSALIEENRAKLARTHGEVLKYTDCAHALIACRSRLRQLRTLSSADVPASAVAELEALLKQRATRTDESAKRQMAIMFLGSELSDRYLALSVR